MKKFGKPPEMVRRQEDGNDMFPFIYIHPHHSLDGYDVMEPCPPTTERIIIMKEQKRAFTGDGASGRDQSHPSPYHIDKVGNLIPFVA